MMPGLGKSLIIVGLLIALVGVLLTIAGKIPWIGRLPGDIFIKRENFTFYFPLATSIIISVILSLILWLFRK
ncbi:putative membrane protein YrzS [Geobacter sp. OR-1]|nr:putative membrane protein YrzS [Geobacter sp. OR-1]